MYDVEMEFVHGVNKTLRTTVERYFLFMVYIREEVHW